MEGSQHKEGGGEGRVVAGRARREEGWVWLTSLWRSRGGEGWR